VNPPDPAIANQVSELSPREREIAVLIARGLGKAEIGEELHRSGETIRTHVQRIHGKLRTSNMAMIAAWAVRAGLVDHPEWYDDHGRFVGGRPAA
jgi:DNA-binding NarL/FixJ family response regulator